MIDFIAFALFMIWLLGNVFAASILMSTIDEWLFMNSFKDGLKVKHIMSVLILPAYLLCLIIYGFATLIIFIYDKFKPLMEFKIIKRK